LEHLQPDTSELHNIVMAVNLCKLMSSISRHAVDMNPFNRKKRRYPGFFCSRVCQITGKLINRTGTREYCYGH